MSSESELVYYCLPWSEKTDKTVEVLKVHLRISAGDFKGNAISSLYLRDGVNLKWHVKKWC